jgi:hypothetical protein
MDYLKIINNTIQYKGEESMWQGDDRKEEKEGRRQLKGHLSVSPCKEPSPSISLK